jgi:hypothetical protein
MYVPCLQVRNSEVIVYREWTGPRYPKKEMPEQFKPGKAYSGRMTDGAAKRLKKCVSLLVQKSKNRMIYNPVVNRRHRFRIGFVTLTVADQKSDTAKDVYKKCMAPFLRWIRRNQVKDYVWKAELQDRGTIHYHIAVNEFLHWKDVRDTWNKYQRKAGYLTSYAKKNGHYHANSTDVHAMRKVKDIERYLTKYMMKEDPKQQIDGKTWDASKNLKDAQYFTTELTPRNLEMLRSITRKELQTDHCTIFRIPQDSAFAVLDNIQRIEYSTHLKQI